MVVRTASERAVKARAMVMELLLADQPARAAAHDRSSHFWDMAELQGVAASRFPARPRGGPAARRQPRGDAGQPRRLHPLQPLRPRLPRGAGERRDRHGRARASRSDRLRHGRPDGRLHLRRLRRVRAGLPHRRADGGERARRRGARRQPRLRARGALGLPLLRRRLPGGLQDQGRQDRLGGRGGRPGERGPALRQGALRLRLREPSAPADPAADPPRGRARRRG